MWRFKGNDVCFYCFIVLVIGGSWGDFVMWFGGFVVGGNG